MEDQTSCSLVNHYLDNYRFLPRIFTEPVKNDTQLIVVIPSYNEPDVIFSLKSLKECSIPEGISVEVIVIINASEISDSSCKHNNQKTLEQLNAWRENQATDIQFLFYLNNELPKKHAGVGLARKIGMDEAVDRFAQIDNHNGIIVCFDADSKCDPNYLHSVYSSFKEHPKANGASIYFEHPIQGEEHAKEIYQGIIHYELFLRYYRQGFLHTNHPQAFHTVGSSMAVRSIAYQKQTGMNKRKAGEDFYFLQKIIQLGNFIEINDTRVIPSPRTSDRVPFGTGKAISEHLNGKNLALGYDFQTFRDIKRFIELVFEEYKKGGDFGESFKSQLPISMNAFIDQSDFDTRREDLIQYGTNIDTFTKRFYNWFNAFRVLKCVHFIRDEHYPLVDLKSACFDLINELNMHVPESSSHVDLLDVFRDLDKKKAV